MTERYRGTLKDDHDRDRREARSFSTSLMSDTKWRALFQAIHDAGIEIREIIVKFVGVEEEKTLAGVWLHTPRPFVDTIEFGPIPMVGVEWLEFPALATPNSGPPDTPRFQQDLAAIQGAIMATGKHFPLEIRPGSLRITAYTG